MATRKDTIRRKLLKALKNGYEPVPGRKVRDISVVLQTISASYVTFIVEVDGKPMSLMVGLSDVLFDHSFAKALWGDNFEANLQKLALCPTITDRISFIGGAK